MAEFFRCLQGGEEMEDKLLTAKEVAKMIGRVIRFSQRDVEAWVQAHKIKGVLKV